MSHKLFRSFFVLILIIGLVAMQAPQPARAAGPWYVATTGDDNNDCLSPTTPCATINGAIGKASSGDTIYVAEGTYTGTGDEVVLLNKSARLVGGWNNTFTLQNSTTIINGNNSRKGVHVNTGVTAVVESFTIQNGSALEGSGISLVGGGIYNSGTLTLNDSIVYANTARYGGGISNGGGVSNLTGTLTINNSIITGNTAVYAGEGGGIYNAGILSLNNSTVSENSAGDSGGGIHNSCCNPSFTQMLVLNNSTVIYNTANRGGGIINGGTAILNNSTISGNNATGNGGGIDSNYGGTLLLNNSTIVGNSANNMGGGVINYMTLTLKNSILANNTALMGPDCSGNINTSVYSIIGDTLGCSVTLGTGDQFNINPKIGMLQNNGGSTFTHALLPASPAIDAGNPAGCTDQDGNLLTTDQRGVARPQGAVCDIGAFELELASPVKEVTIDIKPGSQSNPINRKSSGKIPVTILSTPDFDAPSEIDKASLTFGSTGDEVSLAFCNMSAEDVNSDGFLDQVCHFNTWQTGFQDGDIQGFLKGQTVDGTSIEGRDSVRIVH